MLTLLLISSIVGTLQLTFGFLFGTILGHEIGAVTALPFGLDEGFRYFATILTGSILHIPWAVVPYHLILIAIQVKIAFVLADLIRWIINLVRG